MARPTSPSAGPTTTVHLRACTTVVNEREVSRLIDVEWESAPAQTYPIAIRVEAYDRTGLLSDITQVMAENNAIFGGEIHSNGGRGIVLPDDQAVQRPPSIVSAPCGRMSATKRRSAPSVSSVGGSLRNSSCGSGALWPNRLLRRRNT